jgi:hypothetical protein
MKSALIVTTSKDNETPSLGLTERPNYLSSIIMSRPTTVVTPKHFYHASDDGSPSYDLDAISIFIK